MPQRWLIKDMYTSYISTLHTINNQSTEITGSFVKAALLTSFPKASSWNWSSWTTNAARLLFVGGSACIYCENKQSKFRLGVTNHQSKKITLHSSTNAFKVCAEAKFTDDSIKSPKPWNLLMPADTDSIISKHLLSKYFRLLSTICTGTIQVWLYMCVFLHRIYSNYTLD